MSKFIASYTTIPKELFRINNGPFIHLRGHPGPQRPIGLFDILTYGGKVRPKALNPATYRRENLLTAMWFSNSKLSNMLNLCSCI